MEEVAEPAESDDALFEAPVVAPEAPLALYRRYRPDTFADVIGQEHVTEPLQRALVNNRVNHAYLFSGPRGCGKTTSARILARALNCAKGPAPVPCGECQSCRDLARGGSGSIDVIEIDAASHGGVDDARDLRERAFFSPVDSRYKIYIVDEAHMVTTAGFNALLKLVEEPPPHVKFIFATTEPDKVIGTIRSRTHHYPFRLVPPKVLSGYLGELCEAEGIAVEQAVLPLVVRAGAGSVRDSLSVLDQLLGGASEAGVSYAQATALLGYTPDSLLDEVLDAFAAGDAGGVFACVDKVIEVGQDPRRFAEDLLRRIRDLVIVAAVPDALSSGLVDVAPDQGERLQSQAAALGAGELTRAAEVIAAGLTEMRGTTAPRLHLELMCARVLLPGADVDERGIHARLERLERRIGMSGTGAVSAEATPAPPAPVRTAEPARTDEPPSVPPTQSAPPAHSVPSQAPPVPVQPTAETQQPAVESRTEAPAPPDQPAPDQPAPDQPAPADQPAQVGQSPAEEASAPGALGAADVRRLWPEVLEEVKSRRRFTWILLSQNAHVVDVHDGVLHLGLTNVGARDSFARGGSEDVLKDALVQVLGANLRVEAIVDPSGPSGGSRGPSGGPSSSGPAPGEASPSESSGTAESSQPAESDWPTPAAPGGPDAAGSAAPDDGPTPAGSQDAPAAPPPWAVAAPGSPDSPSSDPRLRDQARGSIRPTRTGGPATATEDEDPSAGATRDDLDLEDASESHNELLARHLGAELISEEEHRP